MSKIENSKIINYINEVCSLVKNKKVHAEIRAELLCHINDTIEDYLEIGIPEDKAIDKALIQMGNAEIIGHDLNKAHKSNSDWLNYNRINILWIFNYSFYSIKYF